LLKINKNYILQFIVIEMHVFTSKLKYKYATSN
jgi:hypothetical protein